MPMTDKKGSGDAGSVGPSGPLCKMHASYSGLHVPCTILPLACITTRSLWKPETLSTLDIAVKLHYFKRITRKVCTDALFPWTLCIFTRVNAQMQSPWRWAIVESAVQKWNISLRPSTHKDSCHHLRERFAAAWAAMYVWAVAWGRRLARATLQAELEGRSWLCAVPYSQSDGGCVAFLRWQSFGYWLGRRPWDWSLLVTRDTSRGIHSPGQFPWNRSGKPWVHITIMHVSSFLRGTGHSALDPSSTSALACSFKGPALWFQCYTADMALLA